MTKKTIKINENMLRAIIRESLSEFNSLGDYPVGSNTSDAPWNRSDERPESEHEDENYRLSTVALLRCLCEYEDVSFDELCGMGCDSGILPESATLCLDVTYEMEDDGWGGYENGAKAVDDVDVKFGDGMSFDDLIRYLSAQQKEGTANLVNAVKSAKHSFDVILNDNYGYWDWIGLVEEAKKYERPSSINEKKLAGMIRESIMNRLNESLDYYYDGSGFEANGTIGDIFDNINEEAYKYENFARQLNGSVQKLQKICGDVIDMLNYNFKLGIMSYENLGSCELSSGELFINVEIPKANFVEACKRNEGVMEEYREEGGNGDIEQLIEVAGYCEWNDLYTSDGTSLGDGEHKVTFEPLTRKMSGGDFVPCRVTITNALM